MFIQKTDEYFKKNPYYNSIVHTLAGVGLGILITYPFIGPHPMRWGLFFLVLGLLGHVYPALLKDKKKGRG